MTVLIVVPWPLRSIGGHQRLTRELGRTLATAHGWAVHVAGGTGLPGSRAVAVDASGPIREVRLPLAPDMPTSWWRSHTTSARHLRLHGLDEVADRVRPDVVMYAAHYSAAAEQAAQVAARLRVPFVALPAIHLDQRGHVNRLARRFYRSADLVVCLSGAERWWLRRRAGLSGNRALWLRCGWDASPVHRRKACDPVLRLLTVGTFAGHKQVDHQLRAIAHLRHTRGRRARLVVAGTLGDRGTLEHLRQMTSRLNIEHDVEFLPDCPADRLRDLYRDADCLLFTSRSESLGLAVLDAIGFGVMPVVYPHPAYGRLVRSSAAGVVATKAAPEALADAVELASRGLAPARDAIRQGWLQRRSWPRASAPLADALQQLVSGALRAHP